MKLSIFLAGIRTQNWLALYDSISNVTSLPKDEYELVIVSPYDLPSELQNIDTVRLIKDWGCPTRCYQLGLLHSRGEYVVWAADDGTFSPTLAIDKAFGSIPKHHKGMVVFRYQEGEFAPKVETTEWWRMRSHKMLNRLPHVPGHYFLIMSALMERSYLMEIGGFDCRFEQPGLAGPDLSVRLQNDGAEVVMGENLLNISHERGTALHKPIEDGHFKNDKPLFKSIYKHISGRSKIDFDNWKQAPAVWSRRFPHVRGTKTGPGYTE